MTQSFELTQADFNALDQKDSNFLLDKGAKYYRAGDDAPAVEYYHLAASLGNAQAIASLGYCYLYGRAIPANISLAMAYLKQAANQNNVDATYKLGDIYGSKKWKLQDDELASYYYFRATELLLGKEWEIDGGDIVWRAELQGYPSLSFAMGRELSEGQYRDQNLALAYQFLKHAEIGYLKAIREGSSFYEDSYNNVKKLMKKRIFSRVRAYFDEEFELDEMESDLAYYRP